MPNLGVGKPKSVSESKNGITIPLFRKSAYICAMLTAEEIISTLPLEDWYWARYDEKTLYKKVSQIIEEAERMAEYIEEDDGWNMEDETYDSVRALFE